MRVFLVDMVSIRVKKAAEMYIQPLFDGESAALGFSVAPERTRVRVSVLDTRGRCRAEPIARRR